MKIIWFSNILISERDTVSSGAWITEMYKQLMNFTDIEIINMGISSELTIKRSDVYCKEQWAVPVGQKWYKRKAFHKQLLDIVHTIDPDLIHLWGTESLWVDFILNNQEILAKYPLLLEMQGVMNACRQSAFEGFTLKDYFRCLGLLDVIFPTKSSWGNYLFFCRQAKRELKLLNTVKYVNTQSLYVKRWVKLLTSAKLFDTGIILRDDFTSGEKWKFNNQKTICSISSRSTIKGLHTTLRAFSIVHNYFPELKLKIAGVNIYKYANFGYVSFLLQLCKKLGISDSVEWVGYINSKDIVSLYNESLLYINSSSCESYCLSLAEALSFGVPCVCSYSAALPEMAIDNDTALIFPKNDYVIAASRMLDIINHKVDFEKMAHNAKCVMKEKNNNLIIVENQIRIYKQIIKNI